MPVLHLTSTFAGGGIATSLWHLLPVLNELSDDDVDGAYFYDKGWFGELLEAEGIYLHQLRMTNKYDPRVIFQLIKLFKNYDVVHAHGWPVILFVALASLFAGKRTYLLTEHSVTNRRRRPLLKWIDRLIYSRFDRIVAVSEAVAESLAAWMPAVRNKITVVYNGIQMDYLKSAESRTTVRERLNLDLDTPIIFASGNFREAKGFDVLLASLETLLERFRAEFHGIDKLPILVVTGEGDLQSSMVELVEKLGISENVHFLGFRTDMPELLIAADLFVLPSRWEGCPMVILESMALSIPVLATRVGGVPELVLDGQTGKLVPPNNPAALAAGMFDLLNDRDLAVCLGAKGKERLTNKFAVQTSAEALVTLYRHAAGVAI